MFEELLKPQTMNENDYIGQDGLIYCGLCHTRKEAYVDICGEKQSVRVMCKCREEQVRKEEAEEENRQKEILTRQRRSLAISDERLLSSTFDKDDNQNSKTSKLAREYARQFDKILKSGKGLLLFGSVGTGKTFLAACIANEVVNNYSALMTSFAEINDKISENMNCRKRIIDDIKRVDLLILDDLGAERNSDYMQELVYEIVNARYESRKPLIVTTNLSLTDIKNPKETRLNRIYDRIIQMCTPVLINGESKRKQEAKKNEEELYKMLGV